MKICRRCLVSGKVQGVFYRASTAEQAKRFGIAGYAKNLPNGSVEVLACGEEAQIKEFIDWLWEGPPAAKVSAVEIFEVDGESVHRGFQTI